MKKVKKYKKEAADERRYLNKEE
jgi:hypothetical protein